MTVKILTNKYKDEIIHDIWEIQDNADGNIVIKFYNHECKVFNKKEILNMSVVL